MKQKEYVLELGWTVDRVKYYLRKMKTHQIIKRVGNDIKSMQDAVERIKNVSDSSDFEVKCTRNGMALKKLTEEIEADMVHYSAKNISSCKS